ncbi:AAA family ATPase [Aestuariibaculum lutulentum]|uniref:EVE domain-containing protein n=1 Tax=Aestuariibaculum lutulentum TaxID=2920935 RepID=A0ABS9REK0_9FLAO|nr:AAA family ATPase [Aestuariibaculum lutulentum]MCH4551372.1 EVE domain-containing protein [Aestuariibaculum lutulentum]
MLFDKVTKEHILQGIKDFKQLGVPSGFGQSSTYDVSFEGEYFPPKAVMAYANHHATGNEIDNNFAGGDNTECFDVFRKNGFVIVKKESSEKNLRLYELKESFLENWPIQKLESMYLEEYTNLDKDSFCYWVEHITRDLGSIVGGSSYKFGIYKRSSYSDVKEESNRTTDGEYAWFKKYGENSKEEAFNSIKSLIIRIAKAARNNDLKQIDDIDLGDGYKWKIAFLYGDYNCLNMFKLDALRVVATNLNIDYTNKTSISEFHRSILAQKPSDKDYFKYTSELWEQYQSRLINVKRDFAKWLDKNTFDSYRAYLGNTVGNIENRLDEVNNFFDDIDFFEVDPNNVNGLISTIQFMMSKKERVKHPDFVEYDSKHSNGIPKALLGKNNYLKFLNDKFSVKTNYWVFQGSPKVFDFEEALNGSVLNDWTVTAHKDKIKVGDKVILWITGSKSGCYALADVTSEPTKKEYVSTDSHLWSGEEIDSLKAGIRITHNLANSPILKKEVEKYRELQNLKVGHQGTNFRATEIEYYTLLNLIEKAMELNVDSVNETHEKYTPLYRTTPVNQILYGPPGTGKTFYLKSELFDKYTLRETSITKDQYLQNVVGGCSWWQVITIALMDLKKAKVSDISEHLWVQIKANLSSSNTVRPTLWGQLQSHTIKDCEYVNVSNRMQPLIFNKTKDSYWELLEEEAKELVPELYDLKSSVDNYNPNPDKIVKNYDFVTFHQSFAYEDFIEGIKPLLDDNEVVEDESSKELGYLIEDGVFKSLCKKAEKDPSNRYAIFIDEINRGNVSAIFGELITLIEVDKRLGAKNEIKIKLPYSKKEFGVPANLDIYGTMNTADRSVEALDTALRRRFEFKEMMPDLSVIKNETIDGVKLSVILEKINQRIELLVDRDHTIGHSYFVNINTKKGLADAFNNKIVPLLQEYFYGDYGKIGLVLGNGFVDKIRNSNVQFADFDYDHASDFKTPTFILKRVDENNVMDAVKTLLGEKTNNQEI